MKKNLCKNTMQTLAFSLITAVSVTSIFANSDNVLAATKETLEEENVYASLTINKVYIDNTSVYLAFNQDISITGNNITVTLTKATSESSENDDVSTLESSEDEEENDSSTSETLEEDNTIKVTNITLDDNNKSILKLTLSTPLNDGDTITNINITSSEEDYISSTESSSIKFESQSINNDIIIDKSTI